jgi:hypothetical protein
MAMSQENHLIHPVKNIERLHKFLVRWFWSDSKVFSA